MRRPQIATFLALLALSLPVTTSPAVAAPSPCRIPAGTVAFGFDSGDNHLRGFIDLPPGDARVPAVAIVHGAGATDLASGGGFYNGDYAELRRAFRDAGFATVVWDKAGQGCSSGGYVHADDVHTRADELLAALAALGRQPRIDPARIGAWAISHGGWVAPVAAARSRAIAFLLLVSAPGGDFFDTWGYQALQRLRADGVPEGEAQAAVQDMHRALAVMRAGGSFDAFTAATRPLLRYPLFGAQFGVTGGTAETYARAQSLLRIWTTDVADVLPSIEVPVLALYGVEDDKVDWRASVRAHGEACARRRHCALAIKAFDGADHELMQPSATADGGRVPAPDYLRTMTDWLRALPD